MCNPRAWTVLIYFAADNDLEGAAFQNHFFIEQLASNERVHLLTQLDGRTQKAKRSFIGGPGQSVEVELPEDPNTGGADALIDFVKWGTTEEHKADNYLLVLWGHGTGIDDDEDDRGAAELRRARREARAAAAREGRAAPSTTSPASVSKSAAERPAGPSAEGFTSVGADVGLSSLVSDLTTDLSPGDPDALTCDELKHAFEVIQKDVLGKKVAIFGMDACLMSMAEIARQVSGGVELMVSSEEVIPNMSWPYDKILRRLLDEPEMTKEKLAETIVDEYVARYRDDPLPVTLSVCRLDRTDELADALTELGGALGELVKVEGLRKAVTRARRNTQFFRFRDYIDLHHFCKVFQETLQDERRFGVERAKAERACDEAEAACQKVMQVIVGEGEAGSGFVTHFGSTSGAGGALANARGVSIYFPPLPPTYADLALSKCTLWDSFLHAYMNAAFRPLALRGGGPVAARAAAGAAVPYAAAPSAPSMPPAAAPGNNGHESRREGEFANMSANQKSPRLLLPKGTTIRDAVSGFEDTLTGHAYLLMSESAVVWVPKDTELDIPSKGVVKASSGTSTKATSGTRTVAVSSELTVPACILSRPMSGVAVELNDGTQIRKAEDEAGDPFVVLDSLVFKPLE